VYNRLTDRLAGWLAAALRMEAMMLALPQRQQQQHHQPHTPHTPKQSTPHVYH
jgi:hypothetical protein